MLSTNENRDPLSQEGLDEKDAYYIYLLKGSPAGIQC
jgi:hypothetical protein